jgi:acyl carrier protein phosphodiesterase
VNFLAHSYLSGNDDSIIIGNFIGDAVKGSNFEGYGPGVVKGIQLHRHIDHYTDTHPIVKESIQRLRPQFKKYAGVVSDMFYDHYLAKNWSMYSNESLEVFAQKIYGIMETNFSTLPQKTQYMLPYMKRHNWLVSYAQIEGVGSALKGLSRRTKFESNMENATAELRENYSDYEAEFNRFFPELVEFSSKKLAEL